MLSLLLLSALTAAEGAVYRISTIDDFTKFSTEVNKGNNFKGTTVVLSNDLDFQSMAIEPIGTNANAGFYGTFDGQGYNIKNALFGASNGYVGLFSYNHGMSIKNVVFDPSTTFSGTNNTEAIGSVAGWCSGEADVCRVENVVNMANIQYLGGYDSTYLGGIIGHIDGFGYGTIVRNCVNFGTILNIGSLVAYAHMGGIAGYAGTSALNNNGLVHIQNCLNLGIIGEAEGSSTWYLYMGGIVGRAIGINIDNCVNDGALISNMTSVSNMIGAITGSLTSASVVSHCFWNDEIAHSAANFTDSSVKVVESYSFNGEYELTNNVTLPTGFESANLVESLNAAAEYYTLREYSRWVLNKDMNVMEFKVANAVLVESSDLILLPTPPNDGAKWFKEWYTDSAFKQPFTAQEITEDVNLYGHMTENTNEYTITFDVDGGSPELEPIKARFGSLVVLPMTPVKDNKYSVGYWATEYGDKVDWSYTVAAHDVTLHPVWKYNRLSTTGEFLEFVANVSNGNPYEGETIYLSADLDFGGMNIEPMGSIKAHFRGTFDGLNHVITNFKVNSSSTYVSLFGYTSGMTLRNLEIGGAATFVSHGAQQYTVVSSFIGYCDGNCVITNCINRANVYYVEDNAGESVHIGGIIGSLGAYSEVVGCTNYGKVEHYGKAYSSYIGGIIGYTFGDGEILVKDCENKGDVIRAGDTERYTDIDAIVGYKSHDLKIENCKNYGKIKGAASSIYLSVALLFFIALMI